MKTDHVQDLFQNKYRIPSARLQNWNYANPGMYFVTICTGNREHYFGEIVETELLVETRLPAVETRCIASLRPTEIGKIAELEWIKTLELRPDMNIELGEFIVMPNHFHGIIIIAENQFNGIGGTSENQFGSQSKNLASILRGYKSAVTTYARKNNIPFTWQPRFHDHIIRSDDAFKRISNYIVNNPANWKEDKFYTK